MPGSRDAHAVLSDVLPRLAFETELQKMLADEKMRSEQHRTNYQTLKAEHTHLQDEYVSLQNELRSTIEESKLVQDKYKTIMDQLRKELAVRHAGMEDLKSQTLNSQKLEMLKLQVTEELEKPYREKFNRLDVEAEKYRNEYNKLKYEYSFLKSEYEHDKQQQQQVVEEIKLRHEAEVTNLRKEREAQIARQQHDSGGDTQRVRVMQRENAQLHLKVKGLLTELEEIRAQREHQGLQSDSVTRLQAKQMAEYAANIKALETERESLKLQCRALQSEIAATSDLQTELSSRVHELERENLSLKNRAEEVTHKSKVDLTDLKMEMLRERGDLERERDRLRNEIEELKNQVEIGKVSLDHQAESLVEKEREAVRRVQAAREEEWQKLHAVQNEKLELETKLQELDRRKIDEEASRHADREKIDDRLRAAQDAKESAEKEVLVLRTKVQHHQALTEQVDRERMENSELKTRLHRIESQYRSYMSSEQELEDANAQLKRRAQELAEDARRATDQLRVAKDDADKVIAQSRATWVEDKMNFQQRISELEDHLSKVNLSLETAVVTHRKKKKKFSIVMTKLKHKASFYKAKMQELEIERDSLKKSVPSDVHLHMRKQLRDIMRRHHEFRTIMLGAGGNGGVGGAMPDLSAMESHHKKDLELLKERLDLLDDNQRHQLEELKGITPAGSPRREGAPPPLDLHDLDGADADVC